MSVNNKYPHITAEIAYDAYKEHGTQVKAARALNTSVKVIRDRLSKYFNHPEDAILHRNAHRTRTPIDDVKAYWVKTDEISMYVRRDGEMTYEEMRDEIILEMSKHAPIYQKLEHLKNNQHLLVIDPADIHIGKLSEIYETGEQYNIETAVDRVRIGVSTLLRRAEPFGLAKIVFVVGNDVIHIDRPHRTTTSGTPQDTDGMWWKMFLEAKKCYIAAIEECAKYADVHVVYCPSNHDYVSGWMLADTVYSWFRNHPNVTFGYEQMNLSIHHRKYLVYGNNLIGFTHGDGAKESDLPNLMQYEAREAWGQTRFAYMYVHHLHHKIRKTIGLTSQKLEKDHTGVTVISSPVSVNPHNNVYIEYVRTPSPSDGWHSRNGYQNMQAIEVFLHHFEYGQVARFSHFF